MFLFDVDEGRKLTLLRAMRAVAASDGEITSKERALLEVSRDALGLTISVDDLPPFDVGEATGPDGTNIVHAMILMAIMDGSAAPEEASLVRLVAERAGVSDARVNNLHQLADGRVQRMRFDLTRRGYAKDELARTAKAEGIAGIYRTFGPIVGLAANPELARRYIALGELPVGTVGRAYFDLITKNDLSFPGESGGLGERGLWHDMLHVAGSYPVDPIGEAEVVAFMAGSRKEDAFFWLFTVALQFQVGLVISPFAPGVRDQIDPRRFILHHKRGALVRIDLSTEWRFEEEWEADLGEVRKRLGVVPLEDVRL